MDRRIIGCACGCGQDFVPNKTTNIFLNKRHQELDRNRRRAAGISKAVVVTGIMKNRYEIRREVTVVFVKHLGVEMECLIDTADIATVSSKSHLWYARLGKGGKTFYVDRREGKTSVQMHRVLTGARSGMEVDHKNHNGLDNRRKENLRVVTKSVNLLNRSGASRSSSSGIRGISYKPKIKKWQASIQVKNKKIYLGVFTSKEEAGSVAAEYRSQMGIPCR